MSKLAPKKYRNATEAERSARGWGRLTLRIKHDDLDRLTAHAQAKGASVGEVVSGLIAKLPAR